MEIQGSIKLIGDVQEISSTFKKRELPKSLISLPITTPGSRFIK